jgi:FKBP-type peptidyl-prolyl cis-trans isomerase
MRRLVLTLVLLVATAPAHARAQTSDSVTRSSWVRTASGLEYQVAVVGHGRRVQRGDTVTIHEALSLPDGRVVFDSRHAPNKAVTFTLGAKHVIAGVEEGVTGMRVGERRNLRVPPALDGRTFDPAFIPPTAIRLYDIEVLEREAVMPPSRAEPWR